MNSKQLNIILGVIAIIAIALLAYVYFIKDTQNNIEKEPLAPVNTTTNTNVTTQQSNRQSDMPKPLTADWKTYTNSGIGFQFKYPQGYSASDNKECVEIDNKLVCNVSLENKLSKLILVSNNPGSGWFGVPNPDKSGRVDIGGVMSKYEFGSAHSEGGPVPGTKVFLTDFTKDGNVYNLAFLYEGDSPDLFLNDTVLPLLETFKFNK